jgi:hypothetical protein
MSFPDEGQFDLVMEVAQQLLLDVAKNVAIPTTTTQISFAGITGTLTFQATVDQVTLGTFPNVNVSLNLAGTKIVADTVPAFLNPVPPSLRTIEIIGDVTIPVPLMVSGLKLQADFTNAGTPVVSQDVFNSIFSSPLILFLLAETFLQDPTGGLFMQTEQLIENTTTQQIQMNVASLEVETLLDASSISTALVGAIGTGVKSLQFGFGNQSIFLLFTIGGTPGTFSRITRSDLLRNSDGEPADRADLIVSNACIMRDFLKPTVSGLLGLTPGGFAPGFGPLSVAPFLWAGGVPFPAAVGGPIAAATITSVIAGIDGTNLRLLVTMTAAGILGTFSVNATIDVTISFRAAMSGGTLTLTFAPVGAPAVSSNVSIAWWVYVAGFAIGGIEVAVIIAAANAVAGSVANGIIAGLVGGAIPVIPIPVPFPGNLPALSVRQVSLFQADASPTLALAGGVFLLPLPFPQNDIIINLI